MWAAVCSRTDVSFEGFAAAAWVKGDIEIRPYRIVQLPWAGGGRERRQGDDEPAREFRRVGVSGCWSKEIRYWRNGCRDFVLDTPDLARLKWAYQVELVFFLCQNNHSKRGMMRRSRNLMVQTVTPPSPRSNPSPSWSLPKLVGPDFKLPMC